MSEWIETTVGGLAASTRNALVGGPFGSNLVSKDYVDHGVPVIRGQNMGARWVLGDFAYVSTEKARSLSANTARPGDIVFTQRGTLGQVALVPSDQFETYVVSQSQMKLTVDPKKADSLFLYYLFSSPVQQEYIRQNSIQVGVPHTNLGILRDTPVCIPKDVDAQKIIARCLGSLDDKIELNRRMNETLEAMARAIFQSWFVDFDPVRAKASGESVDSICQRLGLTPELLALFPDSFEDSELGEIPEGWSPKVFSETIQIIGGGTPKTSVEDFWGGDVPWFSVVDAPIESDVFVIDTEKKITNMGLENSSTKLLPEGVTIISARGTVGKVALVGVPMAMNQSCYGLRGKNSCDVYTYYATRQLVSSLKRHGHGAVFDTITRDTFASVKVVTCDAISKAFDAMAAPNMQRIKANGFHTARLVELRDSLLPKLLTGELSLIVGGAL